MSEAELGKPRRRPLNLRVPPQQLVEIDRQAQAHGLSRTTYMIRAALGELGTDPADERFTSLDTRIMRLERHLGLQ